MDSQQTEYILAVAELKSFSKAAQRLYVTQPSLSQYIIKTERKLGFAIFDRSVSPVSLTPEGEIFVEYAKRFKALEKNMEKEISRIKNERIVRLGAERNLTALYLTEALKAAALNNIRVVLTEDEPHTLKTLLETGALDMAAAFDDSIEISHAEIIFEDKMCLALPVNKDIPQDEELLNTSFKCGDPLLLLELVKSGAGKALIPAAAEKWAQGKAILSPAPFETKKLLVIRSSENNDAADEFYSILKKCVDDNSGSDGESV